MKKFFAILLSAAMLVAMLAVVAVPASAASTNIAVNALNPEAMAPGVSAIFTEPYVAGGYEEHLAFAPISGNTYEVVGKSSYDWNETQGDILSSALEIPEDGFVWAIQWQANNEPIGIAQAVAKYIQIGEVYEIEGLDLENGTYTTVIITNADGSSSTPEQPSTSVDDSYNTKGNVALGAKYDAKGYVISEGEWPASYNANLTDGKAAKALSYEKDVWFGLCSSEGDNGYVNAPDKVANITLDLGASYDISEVKVNTFVGSESGIVKPASVVAYVSNSADGNFTKVGELSFGTAVENVAWASVKGSASGRYVKLEIAIGEGAFAFINEIAVYGAKAGSSDVVVDDSSDEVAEDSSEEVEDSVESDAPATSEPTKDQSSSTTTGDASSMIFFVIIAIVAIAGSAVVVKTRK